MHTAFQPEHSIYWELSSRPNTQSRKGFPVQRVSPRPRGSSTPTSIPPRHTQHFHLFLTHSLNTHTYICPRRFAQGECTDMITGFTPATQKKHLLRNSVPSFNGLIMRLGKRCSFAPQMREWKRGMHHPALKRSAGNNEVLIDAHSPAFRKILCSRGHRQTRPESLPGQTIHPWPARPTGTRHHHTIMNIPEEAGTLAMMTIAETAAGASTLRAGRLVQRMVTSLR